jgi:hypothetical protein
MHSVGGVIRISCCLLPLAALGVAYLLFADRFTAVSGASLARASYGWPFDWVTQDLSRYGTGDFPLTIGFDWHRNWDDPVVMDVNWLLFAADTAIVCAGVTALCYALTAVIPRAARARRRAA